MQLEAHGAQLFPSAVDDASLAALAAALDDRSARPGRRLHRGELEPGLVRPADEIARTVLGPAARAVGAKFFDKTGDRNWSLGWHQDRTIAVRRRIDVPGFAAWTVKSGLAHCEPPFDLLARMLVLRIHLDPTGADNAPLLVAPGSHRDRIALQDIAAALSRLGTDTCLAAPGDVWAYRLPILHASERAAAPARRRVLQLAYSADELPGGLEWLGI